MSTQHCFLLAQAIATALCLGCHIFGVVKKSLTPVYWGWGFCGVTLLCGLLVQLC